MDPRCRQHAETIVDHSVDIDPGDDVVVDANPAGEELLIALHEAIGERGGTPIPISRRTNKRAQRAYLRAADTEGIATPDHELALIEAADVHIGVRSARNVTETGDVPAAATAAYRRALQPVRAERLSKRWCLTQYPAPANAQLAELSTGAYESFVWDAVNKDWAAVREHQQQLVDILDPADEVRIVSGETTDIRLSIAGNRTVNDDGRKNLPGGEVFTAPVPDSVEGEVLFDKPVYRQGREILDARLVFEDGAVIEYAASKNESLLGEIIDTDAGARRVGELGIGMNRDIDRFTYNMLFDEKMGDTVHLALGLAYEETVGPEVEFNDSAVHADMIVDMSDESRIEVDGEVIQRNGRFVFEEDGSGIGSGTGETTADPAAGS